MNDGSCHVGTRKVLVTYHFGSVWLKFDYEDLSKCKIHFGGWKAGPEILFFKMFLMLLTQGPYFEHKMQILANIFLNVYLSNLFCLIVSSQRTEIIVSLSTI